MIDYRKNRPENALNVRALNWKSTNCMERSNNQLCMINENQSVHLTAPPITYERIYKGYDNKNGWNKDSLWNGFYIFVILAIPIVFSFPILLLPQHNSINHPEYWYESTIISCLSALVTLTLETVYVTIKYYLEVPSMVSIVVFIQLYFATVLAWTSTLCLTYLFWSVVLEYNQPMPLTLLLIPIVFITQYGTLYVLVSKHQHVSSDTKKRLKQFIISRVWVNVVELQYQGLGFLFVLLPINFQWILAFALPLVRELNYHIFYKIMIDSLHLDNGKLGIIIGVNAYNALYVAVKIGHTATLTTSICILVVDFLINLHSCKVLVKMHASITPDVLGNDQHIKEREYQLSKLILTELMEIIVPLVYIVTVVIGYNGPNAEILGNIRNDYWQYESIDDIWETVTVVLIMFIFDGLSAVISGFMLWKVCSYDVLRKTTKLIKELWPVIAVNIANYLNYVSFELKLADSFWQHKT